MTENEREMNDRTRDRNIKKKTPGKNRNLKKNEKRIQMNFCTFVKTIKWFHCIKCERLTISRQDMDLLLVMIQHERYYCDFDYSMLHK